MKFYELAIGARYGFRGRRFEKTVMSMANDDQGCGSIFMGETEVTPDGVPLLLPATEAAKWKPDDRHWTEYLSPAPAPREPRPPQPASRNEASNAPKSPGR
jgi:hypothetical protein